MSEPARILVVDDELGMRVTLAGILELEGYHVSVAAGGREALARLRQESFDLLLTDLRMPDVDGLALVADARRLAPHTLIIVLTAHATLDSAIQALRHGAHDYLLKPARADQIVASVQAGLAKRAELLRRDQLVSAVEQAVGPLRAEGEGGEAGEAGGREARTDHRYLAAHGIQVDRAHRSASAQGRPLALTRVEYELLVLLLENLDAVLPCTTIVRAVQGYDAGDAEARAIVRVHVSRLRQKVQNAGGALPVVNVRGVGYRLVGER